MLGRPTEMTEPGPAALRPLAPLRVLQALCTILLVEKLLLFVFAGVFQDEAYYWLWGQHPALSYYDHPPLNAWLQGLSGAIFGWNKLALRLPVALALLADIAIVWQLSRLLAPGRPEHFWTTLLLFLATPMFFAVTAVALPDHLMVTFVLLALLFLFRFERSWPAAPRWSDLYLGAAAIGLAALSKYNGAFVGLGLALAILILPRLRPLLLRPQLYLAGLIAVALQSPVIAWNLQQDLASFGFILGGRHAGLLGGWDGVRGFAIGLVLVMGPFLLLPLARFGLRSTGMDGLARTIFWLSTITIAFLATRTNTLFHWNLVAYLAALPFLALHLRWRWLGWLHVAYGALFLSLMLVNYAVQPLTDIDALGDEATAWAYGWDEAADAVRAAEADHPGAFIAAADYTTASLLGFALESPDVTSLSPRRDQFDYWFDPAAAAGKDAILLGDRWRPLGDAIMAQFEAVTPLAELPVVRGGQEINRFRLYLGTGFSPALP